MAIYEVTQPDGYTYPVRRSDDDKMQLDQAGMSQEQKELLAKINAGVTAPLPKRQPGKPPRDLGYGRNTRWLRRVRQVLGLDGWG